MARSTAWGSTASLSGAGSGTRAGRVVPQPAITNAVAAATDTRFIVALLFGCEQLPVGRVVPQRPERRIEVHHPTAWIPLGEGLLYQRHRGVTFAQDRVDPGPPHRVSAVEI